MRAFISCLVLIFVTSTQFKPNCVWGIDADEITEKKAEKVEEKPEPPKKKKKKGGIGGALGKIAGGKGGSGPQQMIVGLLMTLPVQILSFSNMIIETGKLITTIRIATTDPNTPPENLSTMSTNLNASIIKIQQNITMFRGMPIFAVLYKANQVCATPFATVAMAIPGAGQALASLCNKIAAMDIKVELLFGKADFVLMNALAAKDSLYMRMQQSGGAMMASSAQNMMNGNPAVQNMMSMAQGIQGMQGNADE